MKHFTQILLILVIGAIVGVITGLLAVILLNGNQSGFSNIIIVGIQILGIVVSILTSFILGPLIAPDVQDWLFNYAQHILRRRRTPDKSLDGPGIIRSVPDRLTEGISSLGHFKPVGAELWVVASGKGGVGKSLISLGLAEDLSRRKGVLLLDFDLHNCGLTSLLRLKSDNEAISSYSLLDEFRKMLAGASDPDAIYPSILEAIYGLPEGFSTEHFYTIIEKFAKCRDKPNVWDNLQRYTFLDPPLIPATKFDPLPTRRLDVPLCPENAFILPSRVGDQQLLLTEVATSSYIVVFLFLRALCFWLQGKVDIIVLDCHGAQDMFTAGSILAAQKLVVVTTTDPGSYDGTLELLDVIDVKARNVLQVASVDTAVIFNSTYAWDGKLPEAIQTAIQATQAGQPINIAENDQIREMMKQYRFGQISEHRQLWHSIEKVTKHLLVDRSKEKNRERPTSNIQQEPAPAQRPDTVTSAEQSTTESESSFPSDEEDDASQLSDSAPLT